MSDRLRWGVLGAARVARHIIPLLHSLPRHELVAIGSRDLTRARAFATQWKIPNAVGSYEALLAREDVDVVYVPLPNALHAEWTIKAVEAGKHVLCEKPLATTVADVDAIVAAAMRTGRRVSEAFMYRHHPQTRRVMEVIRSGELGPLQVVRGGFSFNLDREKDVRWDPALGGGALFDLGGYPASFARMVVGQEPSHVFATAKWHPTGVDAACAGMLRFGDSVTSVIDCSFRAAYRASMEVVGTDAVLHVDNPFKPGMAEQLTLVRGERRVTVDVPGETPYAGELEDMARQILDGAAPALSLADSHGNVAALAALHRSAREGRPVTLAEAAA